MEQYYIATEEGQTEGPYSFASLETFYAEGKITQKKPCLHCWRSRVGAVRNGFRTEVEREI